LISELTYHCKSDKRHHINARITLQLHPTREIDIQLSAVEVHRQQSTETEWTQGPKETHTFLPPRKESLITIGQEAGWAPEPVWTWYRRE